MDPNHQSQVLHQLTKGRDGIQGHVYLWGTRIWRDTIVVNEEQGLVKACPASLSDRQFPENLLF